MISKSIPSRRRANTADLAVAIQAKEEALWGGQVPYLRVSDVEHRTIADLTALLVSLSLGPAIETSLLIKLRDASALLGRGNVQGACGKLKDFIAEVSALPLACARCR